jgi:hypothetical protein
VFHKIFPENRAVYDIVKKKYIGYICICIYTGHRRQYDTAHALCMLDSRGYRHTNTHSEYVIQLSHSNNGYGNAPQCYVTRALPVLFTLLRTWSYSGSDTYLVHFNQCSKLLLSTDQHKKNIYYKMVDILSCTSLNPSYHSR